MEKTRFALKIVVTVDSPANDHTSMLTMTNHKVFLDDKDWR